MSFVSSGSKVADVPELDIERVSHAKKKVEAGISPSALDVAHILGADAQTLGQDVLREPAFFPDFPDSRPEKPFSLHEIIHTLEYGPLRSMDHLLASLGLIEDAAPVFAPIESLPRAGVLLAIPPLVASGVLSVAHFGTVFMKGWAVKHGRAGTQPYLLTNGTNWRERE